MYRRTILKPADIVLFRSRGLPLPTRMERFLTWGKKLLRMTVPPPAPSISFALVDLDGITLLEPKWSTTQSTNLHVRKASNKAKIEVYRVYNITSEQVKTVLDWTRGKLGTWDIFQAFKVAGINIPTAYAVKNEVIERIM